MNRGNEKLPLCGVALFFSPQDSKIPSYSVGRRLTEVWRMSAGIGAAVIFLRK